MKTLTSVAALLCGNSQGLQRSYSFNERRVIMLFVVECSFSFDNGACHTPMIKHVITADTSSDNVKALVTKELCKGSDEVINDFKVDRHTPIHLAEGMVM